MSFTQVTILVVGSIFAISVNANAIRYPGKFNYEGDTSFKEDGFGFDRVHSINKRAPFNPLAPVKFPATILLGKKADLALNIVASPLFWFKAGLLTPGNPATLLAAKAWEKVCTCKIVGPIFFKKGFLAVG